MIFAFGDNRENQLASASSRSSNPGTPHLIPEDEIFEQIFTVNLSNISVAKSASATGFLYIWGPIRDKDAHKQMKDLAKTQGGPRYILRKPRRTYITSVPKLFAIYEPLFLTPSEPLVSAGLRK